MNHRNQSASPVVLKKILVIFLVALLVRAGMLLVVQHDQERMYRPDSSSYTVPAVNLLEGHGFSQQTRTPYHPDTLRTPLYPAFIAAVYAISGRNPLHVAGAQVLLSCITAVLVYLLGYRLLKERVAFVGGILFAVSLGPAVYSVFILSETLFTFLLLAGFYFLAIYKEQRKAVWLALGGMVMGLAVLCRPIALFMPVIGLAALLIFHQDRLRDFLTAGLAYTLPFALVLSPWLVRNYLITGKATVTTITGINLIFYNAVSIDAELRGISQEQSRLEIVEHIDRVIETKGWEKTDPRIQELYADWGLWIILAHPLRYAAVHLKNDLNSLLPSVTELSELLGATEGGKGTVSVINQYGLLAGVRHYFGDQLWILGAAVPLVALLVLIYVLSLAGIIAMVKVKHWFSLILLASPVLYLILLPGAPSVPRFRVPAMPYLCLLAGVGAVVIFSRVQRRRLAAD